MVLSFKSASLAYFSSFMLYSCCRKVAAVPEVMSMSEHRKKTEGGHSLCQLYLFSFIRKSKAFPEIQAEFLLSYLPDLLNCELLTAKEAGYIAAPDKISVLLGKSIKKEANNSLYTE